MLIQVTHQNPVVMHQNPVVMHQNPVVMHQNPLSGNCIICMNTEKIGKNHPCPRCSKDAWKICDECLTRINNCPVCRLENIRNNSNNEPTQGRLFLKGFCPLLQLIAFFTGIIYLGKVYIYLLCITKKCYEEEKDNCLCHRYLDRDNYWLNFNYFISEFIIGIMFTCLILGMCCMCFQN